MNVIIESVLKRAMGLNISSISNITLENALARRMRALKIDEENDYIRLLQSSKLEMNDLIDEVAVNETWFFRDNAPFSALRQYTKKKLAQKHNSQLRILSIPCATGEEPYSIVMTLYEAGIPEDGYSIDAVDISKRSLQNAQRAIFRKRSFRGTRQDFKNIYFKEVPDGYLLADTIKSKVHFIKGNLISSNLSLTYSQYDIIFCRNLLIYLNAQSLKKAISTLETLLTDDGLLFIGHAEAGYFSNSNFSPAKYPKAFSFVKTSQLTGSSTNEITTTDYLSNTQPSPEDIKAPLTEKPLSLAPGIDHVKKLIIQNKFDNAQLACEQLASEYGPNANIFYYLGLTLKEKNQLKEAIHVLKKAIYLDPEFIEALELLTAIYEQLSDQSNYKNYARRSKRVKDRLANQRN